MFLSHSDNGCKLIIINKGECLIETLTRYITDHKIQGGVLAGIGALKNVELGYYDLVHQTYLRKNFDESDFELISFHGNIALKDSLPFIHAHVLLGRRDFSTFGGHLFEATVAVVAEISLMPLGKMPKRELDVDIGLSLICGWNKD